MVKRTLTSTSKFLFKAQNTIISAAAILAFTSGLNAFLGLIKNRLLTYYFGVSTELSVFYTADRIPSLIYSVLVVGAISTVFIPIFTSAYKNNIDKAWKSASAIINTTLLIFIFMSVIALSMAPQIINLLALGKFSPSEVALGAKLMQIMLATQIILLVSSFLTSILQSFKFFLVPALASLVYNLGMIIGTVFLSQQYGILAPAYGGVLGAFLHLIVQIPGVLHTNLKFHPSLNLRDKGIKEMVGLVPARIVSVLIANLIYTANNSLAILVSTSSVVILKFASQLQFLPVSLFGLSIASAALPTLSAENGANDNETFKKTFLTSLHQILFLVIPSSVFLLILKLPVVRLVYGVPNFPWEATLQTANALAFFSVSIPAQSVTYLVTRAFYALHDTKTPVKISLITIFVNIFLSLLFVKEFGWGVWSIALSFSITSLLDTVLLLYLLHKKLGFNIKGLVYPFLKISTSALFMGLSLYIPLKILDQYVLDTARTLNLIILTAAASVTGFVSYLFFTRIFKVEEVQLLYKLFRRLHIPSNLLVLLSAESKE